MVSGAWTLFSQIDVLLIGAFVGSAEVGIFSAPLRLCTLLHYPGLAVQNSVAPRLARGPGREPDVQAFEIALRGLIILQAAVLVPILVWASPIIDLLLGPGYARSAGVLRALAPFVFLQGIGPLITVGVNYLGESRLRIRIAIAAFLIDLVLDVILIPHIGALGGAIATSVAFAMYVPAHLLLCRKLLGISLRPLAITSIRALVAAAGAAGVLWLFGTSGLSLSDWVLGQPGATATFIGLILAIREVAPSELHGLWVAAVGWLRPRAG